MTGDFYQGTDELHNTFPSEVAFFSVLNAHIRLFRVMGTCAGRLWRNRFNIPVLPGVQRSTVVDLQERGDKRHVRFLRNVGGSTQGFCHASFKVFLEQPLRKTGKGSVHPFRE